MNDDFTNQSDAEEGAPEWIVTFADMMSLLLTFFILLLSFATLDAERFRELAESLRESFTFSALPVPGRSRPASVAPGKPEKPLVQPAGAVGPPAVQDFEHQRRLQDIKQQVDRYIAEADLELFIQTRLTGNGLIIVNSDPLSFSAGRADLESRSVQYLEALLPALMKYDYNVMIEGHTDDRPIQTSEFPSNWELSTARASRFARYLIERGVAAERLSVAGFAEFRPVAPNDTEKNRARNRRIEILLKYDGTGDQLQLP